MKLKGLAFLLFVIGLCVTSVNVFGQLDTARMFFPDFSEGTVFFKDGTQTLALLNYDTYEEEMIFKNGKEVLALASPELVKRVEINNRIFVWFEDDIFLEKLETLPESIYIRNRKQLISKGKGTAYGGVSNTSSIQPVDNLPRGYDKQATKLRIDENFELQPDHVFYIKEKDVFKSLSTPKDFSKVFGGNKKEVTKYIQSEKLDILDLNDVKKIIEFCKKD